MRKRKVCKTSFVVHSSRQFCDDIVQQHIVRLNRNVRNLLKREGQANLRHAGAQPGKKKIVEAGAVADAPPPLPSPVYRGGGTSWCGESVRTFRTTGLGGGESHHWREDKINFFDGH